MKPGREGSHLSMDDVLESVKRSFADDGPLASAEAASPQHRQRPETIDRTSAQHSIRAHQARLAATPVRRRALPPIPDALRRNGLARPSQVMRADVPVRVQVNAVTAQPAPQRLQPRFRWGDRRARDLDAAVTLVPAAARTTAARTTAERTTADALSPVQAHAKAQTRLPKVTAKPPKREPVERPAPTDEDWNGLKAELRQAVDQWVDRQRATRASSQ